MPATFDGGFTMPARSAPRDGSHIYTLKNVIVSGKGTL